jgi:hypothetical protein
MKNIKLWLLLIALLYTTFAKAQVVKDSIEIRKSTFGTIYLNNEKSVDDFRLYKIIKTNPETLSEIRAAKTNLIFSSIFSFSSGFIFGYQYGSRYKRSSPNWLALGAATGLLGISIPLSIASNKHTRNAVNIYNKNPNKTAENKKIYYFNISDNGLGLKISF